MNERPYTFGLAALAAVYLVFLLLSAASYGDPFVFMGKVFTGPGAERFVVGDTTISLYLLIGILKRQLLTWWLLLAYNLLDVFNSLINLFLLPSGALQQLAGEVPEETLRFNIIATCVAVALLNVFIYRRRHLFVNRSPYLF